MQKLIILFFTAAVLFSSCNNQGENKIVINPPKIRIDQDTLRIVKPFKGLYSNFAGVKTFSACDQPGIIHGITNTTELDSLYKKIHPNAYVGQAIYVEMTAEISSSPDKGYADLLTVKSCEKAEQKNHKNTCITSDYWGFGSEPFWLLQISKKEDLIDFYNPMEQTTTHFHYSAPATKNELVVYSAEENGNKINIIIKKEKCNGAIDPQYEYSVKVELNGRIMSGCARKP